MTRFLIRRLLLSIPVLFGIVFVVFALARIIPGDPCVAALGERANPKTCAQYSAAHGLDKAIVPGFFRVDGKIQLRVDEIPATLTANQFVDYLGSVVKGDFGTSSKFGLPVTDLLLQRLPATVELALYALLFAIVVGIPLGIISAYRRNSIVDVGTMMFTISAFQRRSSFSDWCWRICLRSPSKTRLSRCRRRADSQRAWRSFRWRRCGASRGSADRSG